MSRLVVVSNRTPSLDAQRAAGGLVVALQGALSARGGLWFGWSGAVAEGARDQPILREANGISLATLDLSPEDYSGFYLAYCNGVLWPLCHGSAQSVDASGLYRDAYEHANRRYALALRPLLRHDDLVWVHDYHLLTLGRWLRAIGEQHRMGFFLHVPFPEPRDLRTLPNGAALVRAMCAYDLIGFQTRGDLDAFVRAARGVWGQAELHSNGMLWACGKLLQVGVFPISIDPEAVAREAQASRDLPLVAEARARRRDRNLLIAADRLVASKGVEQRFQAYRSYLTRKQMPMRPPLLWQIGVPRSHGTPLDAQLAATIDAMASQIDAQHASPAASQLRYLRQGVAHAELMGLLRAAHVGLITPLRDGMNLVAKEYVAAQDPEDPGMLVLSAHAGAARELDAALLVDPLDTVAVAAAIAHATAASLAERRERHGAMLATLRRNDLQTWQASFLHRLAQGRPECAAHSNKPAAR